MEAKGFNRIFHSLTALVTRRGRMGALTAGVVALVVPGLSVDAIHRGKGKKGPHGQHTSHHTKPHAPQPHEEGKKHKKKKKKKRNDATSPPSSGTIPPPGPTPTCVGSGQTCTGDCCSPLQCETVAACGPLNDLHGPACYAGAGNGCSHACDCRGDLLCSERQGDTCQSCAAPQSPCASNSDCCLSTSTCASNGCEEFPNQVCCQGLGASCIEACDCCAGLDCDEELEECVPLAPPE